MVDDAAGTASPFGAALAAARQRKGLNVRQAATLAGISEGRWRQLELGFSQHGAGVRIPARPKTSTVLAVARAVGLDLREAFEKAGLPVPEDALAAAQAEIDVSTAGGSAEAHLTRREEPDLSTATTDALLAELRKRAIASNSDTDR